MITLRAFSLYIFALIGLAGAWPVSVFERALTQNIVEIDLFAHSNVSQQDVVANLNKAWSTMRLEKRQKGFNAQAQRISTTGHNVFRSPGPYNQRGNCPGLNG